MLTRIFFVAMLTISATAVLTGARSSTLAQNTPPTQPSFVAQDVPLDAEVVGAGVDANQLLDRAIAKLTACNAGWLRTKIRQTTKLNEADVVAEGWLQRGPNQCARLEMELGSGQTRGRLVVVSDGAVIAQIRRLPGALPIVVLDEVPGDSSNRDALLQERGCSAPLVLVRDLRQHLREGTLQTGLLNDAPVVQIGGDIDAAHAPAAIRSKAPILFVRAYLDARTLWPSRLQWFDSADAEHPILRIEFADVAIGHALSLEECAGVFSYHPGGDERVLEKEERFLPTRRP